MESASLVDFVASRLRNTDHFAVAPSLSSVFSFFLACVLLTDTDLAPKLPMIADRKPIIGQQPSCEAMKRRAIQRASWRDRQSPVGRRNLVAVL